MGNINEVARQILLAFLKLGMAIAALVAGGCAGPSPESPVTPGASRSPDTGEIRYTTASGKPVVVTPSPGGATFEIRDGDDVFGFSWSEEGFGEWAVVDGQRESLQVEYRADLDVEVVRYNGKVVQVTRADPAAHSSFEAAVTQAARLKRPLSESTLYDNRLGEELVASIGSTLHDLGVQQRWVDDDGSCSRELTTVAGACARWKCSLGGGLANPVCHVCIGTTVACVVMAIANLNGD